MTGTPLPPDDCCLPDIRISELPIVDTLNYDDLVAIDRPDAAGVYRTRAITWGHLIGIYPPGNGGGGGGNGEGDVEIILNGITKFPDGTELRPSITFINDDNTGFYRPDDNTIGFTTGGTRTVVMRQNYVGLGTDFPLEKLHIEEGNILVGLGQDDNQLYLGSSNRGIGGDPSIQSSGAYPLTFHIDGRMIYKFSITGAFEVSEGVNSMGMSPGRPGYILSSRGAADTPQWLDPDTIWDLSVIIGDIDQNYIGKGIHFINSKNDGSGGAIDDSPKTVYPDPVYPDATLSSGLDVEIVPESGTILPNANNFGDNGWKIKVDNTVVRTGGYQKISGTKVFDPSAGGSTVSEIALESGARMYVNSGAVQEIRDGGMISSMSGGVINLFNRSEFLFERLPHISSAPQP